MSAEDLAEHLRLLEHRHIRGPGRAARGPARPGLPDQGQPGRLSASGRRPTAAVASLARWPAPEPETLKRTPLHDRHVAAGRQARARSPAGRCRCSTRASARSTSPCAAACGMFDVSHMGEIETSGPQAAALLQRLLSNDVEKLAVGGAQYSVLCREDGGVLDDLFTYRLGRRPLPDGHQRLQPREGPRLVHGARRRLRRRGGRRRTTATRCSPSRARARASSCRPSPTRRCPTRMTAAAAHPRRAPALVCGTGYTGEDGVELLFEPDDAPALWDAARRPRRHARRPGRARHAAPGGLLPPLRQRPHGGARADRGRPGLVLQGGHGLHRLRRRARRSRGRPRREARPLRLDGPGHRAPGQPGRGRRRGDQRHALARAWRSASAWPTCPPSAPPGHDARDRRARPRRQAVVAAKPLYRKEHSLRRDHPERRPDGRRELSRRPALPPRARLGRGSTATPPPSGSPGTPRTPSARSSSSTRPRSARA